MPCSTCVSGPLELSCLVPSLSWSWIERATRCLGVLRGAAALALIPPEALALLARLSLRVRLARAPLRTALLESPHHVPQLSLAPTPFLFTLVPLGTKPRL